MSIRVHLVPLFGTEVEDSAIRAACALARRFDGHVLGLFARTDASEVVPYVGEGISPAAIEQLTRAANEEMDRRRDAARGRFEAVSAAAKVALTSGSGAEGPRAEFVELSGNRDEILAARGRLADLVLVSGMCTASGADERGTVEAILLGSGRPLLVVPHEWSGSVGHNVAIAWNGRAEAARALALAMPLVESAEAVHVLTAATSRTGAEAAEELSAYLSWHGIAAERHGVTPEDEPVGAALLRTAKAAGADLLVMGGYGRSRLAELVMGGVTRHVLGHADLPVFLAH